MIPYGLKITADFLRAHDAVTAICDRVVTKTPSSTSEPWVRVARLDARNEAGSAVEHLIDFLLQFDCYAGSEGGLPEAELLGRTVRAALHDDLPGTPDLGAVVTNVRIVGDTDLPDTTFEPARDRVAITALIWMHN